MHYSKAQDPFKLGEWAQNAARELATYTLLGYRVILVYSGMSGVSSATALLLEYARLSKQTLDCVYVRKENERSHGTGIERNFYTQVDFTDPKTMILFVDDFVCSGETTFYMMKKFVAFYRTDFEEVTKRAYLSLSGHNSDVDYEKIVKLEESKFFNRILAIKGEEK